jgi:predicted DNA-binding transcriptional regulator YafY
MEIQSFILCDILRCGDDAEVIGPKELRKTFKMAVAGMLEKYEK